jgi:3-oxoacyl-[acyl-carrier-protein] synthase-3
VLRSVVTGVGAYLPEEVVTNADLSKIIETTDAWIVERTGIHERRRAAPEQGASDLAVEAARKALAAAGRSPADLDLIIVATTTPDLTFPATAALVQRKLGAPIGIAFDIQAVCSGFVYALSVADGFVARGLAKCALVIGSETMTRLMDWTDRGTCVLFEVFRNAVVNISEAVESAAKVAGVAMAEVDWFIPHQANQRILAGVAHRLGIDEQRVISTVARHANTSAASIPLAWAEAIDDGRIKPGQLLLLEAMGGGLTWGACVVRF